MNESTPVGNIRSLSLRDPSGNVFEFNSQLFRQVHSSAKSEWEVIKQSKALKSFIEKMKQQGVLFFAISPTRFRMVTHLNVTTDMIEMISDKIKQSI